MRSARWNHTARGCRHYDRPVPETSGDRAIRFGGRPAAPAHRPRRGRSGDAAENRRHCDGRGEPGTGVRQARGRLPRNTPLSSNRGRRAGLVAAAGDRPQPAPPRQPQSRKERWLGPVRPAIRFLQERLTPPRYSPEVAIFGWLLREPWLRCHPFPDAKVHGLCHPVRFTTQ